MTGPVPLPGGLRARPFVLTDPQVAGLSRSRLRAKDLLAPGRSIRVPVGVRNDLHGYAAAVLALTPGAWLSHITAAKLYRLWLPPRLQVDDRIHVYRPGNKNPPRRQGVCGHVGRVQPSEVGTLDGLPIATPSRTWFDLLPLLRLNEAVIIGDQLVRVPRPGLESRRDRWCSIDDLAESLALNNYRVGVALGREVLRLVRVGADSPPETLLRLAIINAGLPEPELQIELDPGRDRTLQGDLGYRKQRLVLQYDGAHHLQRAQQTSDIRRDEHWRDRGWQVQKCDAGDLHQGFARVLNWLRPRLL